MSKSCRRGNTKRQSAEKESRGSSDHMTYHSKVSPKRGDQLDGPSLKITAVLRPIMCRTARAGLRRFTLERASKDPVTIYKCNS
jgi:hypothetical protein